MAGLNSELDPRVGHTLPRACSCQNIPSRMKNPISARKVTPMIADMRGREFITLIGGSAAAWPLARAATNETRPSCLIRTVHELAVPMREQLTSDAGGLIRWP